MFVLFKIHPSLKSERAITAKAAIKTLMGKEKNHLKLMMRMHDESFAVF